MLEIMNSGPALLFCILLSRAGWLSCVLLVFLFLFFLYILDLGQGFVERDVPHAVPSCCYPTKQVNERVGMKGRRAACTWHICALPVESSVESPAGKVCKQSSCLQGLKGVCQISNMHGTSRNWYQVVGATRV